MTTPSGLGLWVAYGSRIGDAAAIVARAQELGAGWLALRVDCWSKELGRLLREAAIGAYVWRYDGTPSNPDDDVAAFTRVLGEGADGVILDGEVEWDRDLHADADAHRFGELFRKRHSNAFLADAPWPWIAKHPTYPAAALAEYVDARLTQSYWSEIGVSMKRCCDEEESEWSLWEAKHPTLVRPRWPIGVTYPKVSTCSPSDVIGFLDRYADMPVSLYSMEAATPAVAAELRRRATERRSTEPAPPQGVESGTQTGNVQSST